MQERQSLKRWIEPGIYTCLFLIAIAGGMAHYFYGFSHAGHSQHAWGSDDAYISYRYAANFAEGRGLVFNPGDGQRVEGYTNFLYVVLLAGLMRVFAADAYTLSFCVNMVFFAGTLVLFAWYVKKTLSPGGAILACSCICLCPLMWAWPSSGLETSAVLLVQLAIFIAAELGSRNPSAKLLALICSLACMSLLLRADGFVFPLICGMFFLFRSHYREFAVLTVFVILSFLICVAARYCYYGEILPNTYYAKVCGSVRERVVFALCGLKTLSMRDALFLYVVTVLFGWNPFILNLWRERKLDLSLLPAIPVAAASIVAYWLYVGGDVFYERFLLILIPLSLINFFYLLGSPKDWITPLSFWKPVLVLLVMLAQLTPYIKDERFAYQSSKYDMWVCLGKHLSEKYPNATLATCAAGKIPFYSHLDTVDMLGLTDAHIGQMSPTGTFVPGHSKYDSDYVLSRQPQLIATWGAPNLDLGWGITREKYAPQGYVLKYVVNSLPESKGNDIVAVDGLSDQEIAKLHAQGYDYYIVAKEEGHTVDALGIAGRPSHAKHR